MAVVGTFTQSIHPPNLSGDHPGGRPWSRANRFKPPGNKKKRRFCRGVAGLLNKKLMGMDFFKAVWQTWEFMICCFFCWGDVCSFETFRFKGSIDLFSRQFSRCFCWSLSDPKFHGMSFCQGTLSTVFFQWEFVSKKHEMPNYTTSHIPTFVWFRHQLWRFRNVFINICMNLLWWPSLGTERLWLDPKIIPKTSQNTGNTSGGMTVCLFWGFESHPRFWKNATVWIPGPSEPKNDDEDFQRQVLASKSAWSHCRCDEEHHVASLLGRWGDLANLRADDLFGMVGRLRSGMKIDAFFKGWKKWSPMRE